MNAHQEVIELFSPYVDAALPAAEEARLEAHLAACEPCRLEYGAFAEAVSLVRELPRHKLPAAFSRRVLARTRAERRRRLREVRAAMLPVPAEIALPVVLLAAVAAVVVLVLLGG